MDRITINLSDETGEKLRAHARTVRRTLSDAGALLIEASLSSTDELTAAAAEYRALGLDPVAALRERLAAVDRAPALSR